MDANNVVNPTEWIFLFFFVVLVFGVPALVVWASYSSYKALAQFDVSQLWLHRGRVDKFAVIVMGTWWLHSSSIILWTLLRTIQTQDYVTYMMWGTLIIGKMIVAKNGETKTENPIQSPTQGIVG